MKPCLEWVVPRCHERPVTFSLPSLAAIGNGEIDDPSPQNVSRAMNAMRKGQPAADLDGRRRRRRQGTRTSAMPKPAAIVTVPARPSVEGSLFNLEEKSSCRFSADAGSGFAVHNS
jgi:hypothetical protein